MANETLLRILDGEANAFQKIDRRWRPVALVPVQFRGKLLADVKARYVELEAARPELATLDRADIYIKYLYRMRLAVRQARFSWRFDDLSFIQAISDFYTAYGSVLRLLAVDKARGRLEIIEKGV